MSDDIKSELLNLSQQLLDSIDQQNWSIYAELCDPSLSAFEPEAVGSLVEGMPFHKTYFEMKRDGNPVKSTISSPSIRLMTNSAVVTYIRLTQRIDDEGHPTTTACEETRIWERQNGKWQHVHFHRSKAGFIRL